MGGVQRRGCEGPRSSEGPVEAVVQPSLGTCPLFLCEPAISLCIHGVPRGGEGTHRSCQREALGELELCAGEAPVQSQPLSERHGLMDGVMDGVVDREGRGQERLRTKAGFRKAGDGGEVGGAQSGIGYVLTASRCSSAR